LRIILGVIEKQASLVLGEESYEVQYVARLTVACILSFLFLCLYMTVSFDSR